MEAPGCTDPPKYIHTTTYISPQTALRARARARRRRRRRPTTGHPWGGTTGAWISAARALRRRHIRRPPAPPCCCCVSWTPCFAPGVSSARACRDACAAFSSWRRASRPAPHAAPPARPAPRRREPAGSGVVQQHMCTAPLLNLRNGSNKSKRCVGKIPVRTTRWVPAQRLFGQRGATPPPERARAPGCTESERY
eukprot:COSAG01_NODE_4279_length_5181_cov_556.950433_2_plen_195_part_00